jgi:hypothetical protein
MWYSRPLSILQHKGACERYLHVFKSWCLSPYPLFSSLSCHPFHFSVPYLSLSPLHLSSRPEVSHLLMLSPSISLTQHTQTAHLGHLNFPLSLSLISIPKHFILSLPPLLPLYIALHLSLPHSPHHPAYSNIYYFSLSLPPLFPL